MYNRDEYKRNRIKYLEKTKEWSRCHPWYSHYHSAKNRCEKKYHPNYKNYGGRGIRVLMSLPEFEYLWYRDRAWEMKKPSIDRINNKDHYTLENCRFIEFSLNNSRGHLGNTYHLGKKHTKESKLKMRIARKKWWLKSKEETNERNRHNP